LYLRPTTLDEALHALAQVRGTILSGGTDFFPALGDQPFTNPVVDISGIADIKGIQTAQDHIHIGGRTTWSELLAAPLPRGFDGLKGAAREVGGIQIQNRGTVAGNLCNASPAADGVPPLLALDAEVTLASLSGTRSMPLSAFIMGNRKTARRPDEILTSIQIPRRLENSTSAFLKLGARRYLVISIAMVAANVLVDGSGRIEAALVAVGSCSVKAQRLRNLEGELRGTFLRPGIGKALSANHLAPLSPIDDVRGTAAYRREAAQVLVARALESCARQVA
jgi:CO/xanthine dehydrogenase FAD-binding subunit